MMMRMLMMRTVMMRTVMMRTVMIVMIVMMRIVMIVISSMVDQVVTRLKSPKNRVSTTFANVHLTTHPISSTMIQKLLTLGMHLDTKYHLNN